jgi:serine/threonine-protein kinase HipA
MGRIKTSSVLDIFMNGAIVAKLSRLSSGKLELIYSDEWIESDKSRSISLSLPIVQKKHSGIIVEHYFDNLLPDSQPIRNRIQARFRLSQGNSFDLLSVIGRDCVGALQLLPEDSNPPDVRTIHARNLTDKQIAEMLKNYSTLPLGMDGMDDFRISIAGAQEKTALLFYKNNWCRPDGATPTSHIFKLPIGVIEKGGYDLSDSVENEWLCHLILKEFNIPTANMEIFRHENTKALIVERFDRVWADDRSWLIRLPQEDICQAKGVSPALKYENDGGPGIRHIMDLLMGSSNMREDRNNFMKTVFIFWILGAIDGHAKNFSIFLNPEGAYQLTPVYDVISAYPLIAKKQIAKQKLKMAMAVRGKSVHYEWDKIKLRHWMTTAKLCRFPEKEMTEIIDTTLSSRDRVIESVLSKLPEEFPSDISGPVFDYLKGMKFN